MIFVKNSRGGTEVNMISTVSKINLSKIGYNSGYNIKYIWLLKVKYLLNGSTDLNEILDLSS